MSYCKVICEGTILSDTTLKGSEGKEVCSFYLGINRSYKLKDEQYPKSNSYLVKAFGNNAKFVNEYFNKKDEIVVFGELDIDEEYTFTNQQGQEETRPASVYINVNQVTFPCQKRNACNNDSTEETASAPAKPAAKPAAPTPAKPGLNKPATTPTAPTNNSPFKLKR